MTSVSERVEIRLFQNSSAFSGFIRESGVKIPLMLGIAKERRGYCRIELRELWRLPGRTAALFSMIYDLFDSHGGSLLENG
jgi:hypothetical protein